jgi:hypothetical protein
MRTAPNGTDANPQPEHPGDAIAVGSGRGPPCQGRVFPQSPANTPAARQAPYADRLASSDPGQRQYVRSRRPV